MMDNLPTEAMAMEGEGSVIAVDFSEPSAYSLSPGEQLIVPSFAETIFKVMPLSESDDTRRRSFADLLIRPDFEDVGILEFHMIDHPFANRDAVQRPGRLRVHRTRSLAESDPQREAPQVAGVRLDGHRSQITGCRFQLAQRPARRCPQPAGQVKQPRELVGPYENAERVECARQALSRRLEHGLLERPATKEPVRLRSNRKPRQRSCLLRSEVAGCQCHGIRHDATPFNVNAHFDTSCDTDQRKLVRMGEAESKPSQIFEKWLPVRGRSDRQGGRFDSRVPAEHDPESSPCRGEARLRGNRDEPSHPCPFVRSWKLCVATLEGERHRPEVHLASVERRRPARVLEPGYHRDQGYAAS